MGKNHKKQSIDWQEQERMADLAEKAVAKAQKDKRCKLWVAAGREYLKVNPMCYDCNKRGYVTPAIDIAHIEPPKNQVMYWNIDNWQGLCESCYQRIVADREMVLHDPIPHGLNLYTVK